MDASVTEAVVGEDEVLSPRATLESIAKQADIALTERVGRRFSTRDSLKALEKRCRTLLEQPEDHAWHAEFEKIITTAAAVFDTLIAEVEPAGNA